MGEIILGIDPGSRITGYGIIHKTDRLEPLDFGCIRPPVSMKFTDKCHAIYQGIDALIEKHRPKTLVIETQFIKLNVKTAFNIVVLRGFILACAKNRGLKVYEYAPTKIKVAVTGKGHAKKHQVQAMIQNQLNLPELPTPEDAADALACCICHAHQYTYEEV